MKKQKTVRLKAVRLEEALFGIYNNPAFAGTHKLSRWRAPKVGDEEREFLILQHLMGASSVKQSEIPSVVWAKLFLVFTSDLVGEVLHRHIPCKTVADIFEKQRFISWDTVRLHHKVVWSYRGGDFI